MSLGGLSIIVSSWPLSSPQYGVYREPPPRPLPLPPRPPPPPHAPLPAPPPHAIPIAPIIAAGPAPIRPPGDDMVPARVAAALDATVAFADASP